MVSLHITPLYGLCGKPATIFFMTFTILTFQIESMVIILHSLTHLVVSVDKVGEEEVELPDGDVDVIGVDAEGGVEAVWGFLQSLPVRRLKGNRLEEDDLDKVKPPDLVGLSEAVDSPHLALLVGVGEDAHCRLLAGDGEDKVLATLLSDIFPQLSQ